MNRLRDLIRFIVEHRPGCGRTMIVKYLYLADLEARRFLGRPLSELRYRLDFHGPFDPQILEELDRAVADGVLRRETVYLDGDVRGFFYSPASASTGFELTAAELAILQSVLSRYGAMPLSELLEDVVYETEPMKAAIDDPHAFRKPLPMGIVDNTRRIPGLELEEVYEADAQLRAGQGRPLREIVSRDPE